MKNEIQPGGGWKSLLADALALLPMHRDGCFGSYRGMPKWCVVLPVVALAYVLCPFDFAPDFLPLLGQLDDAGVIFLCFRLLEPEIGRYRRWRGGLDE